MAHRPGHHVPIGVTFTVLGDAVPQGSKTAIPTARGWRVKDSAEKRGKPWKAEVKAAAAEEMRGGALLTGPLCLIVRIERVRPAGHYGKGGALNAAGRRTPYPVARPDLLKLTRAIEDALTGVVWRDDAQVVEQHLEKRWGGRAQVMVAVWIKEPD